MSHKQQLFEGLWKNNPGIVQLLGLCPLLAVSGTVANALGLGLATIAVLVVSNLVVSLVRNWIPRDIRIPIYVLLIAALVSCVELIMNAYVHQLYLTLGIFIPLIVTNCIIIGRAESFASRNPPLSAVIDGVAMGVGFTLVLMLLGGIREVLGQGTLFSGMHLLLGDWAQHLTIELYQTEHHFLLAVLPPGAFFAMGLIIAAKNAIDQRRKQHQVVAETPVIERARITQIG